MLFRLRAIVLRLAGSQDLRPADGVVAVALMMLVLGMGAAAIFHYLLAIPDAPPPAPQPRPNEDYTLQRQTRHVLTTGSTPATTMVAHPTSAVLIGYSLTNVVTGKVTLSISATEPDGVLRVQAHADIHTEVALGQWHDLRVDVALQPGPVGISLEGADADTAAIVLSTPAMVRKWEGLAPRNLILVSIDTLRADYMGLYGFDEHPTSPNLDAWAKGGAVFERVVAPSPWTIPSHAAVFSGRHPDSLGLDKRVGRTPRIPREIPTLAELFRDAGYVTVAFAGTATMAARNGLSDGFYLYQEATTPDVGILGDLTTNLAAANRWLNARNEQPLFMFFHTYEVHEPYRHNRFQKSGASKAETRRARYASGIAYTDERIVRWFDSLERRGLLEDSLLVLMSDHGEAFEEHGSLFHGKSLYREVLWVPLVFRGAGMRPGLLISQPVALADLFPTLTELYALPTPQDIPTRSFAGLLRGKQVAARPFYLCCTAKGSQQQGMRTPSYKYITMPNPPGAKGATHELYDLTNDPLEKHDLSRTLPVITQDLAAKTREQKEANRARAKLLRQAEVPRDELYLEELRALGYLE